MPSQEGAPRLRESLLCAGRLVQPVGLGSVLLIWVISVCSVDLGPWALPVCGTLTLYLDVLLFYV